MPNKFVNAWTYKYPWCQYEFIFNEDQKIWEEKLFCKICMNHREIINKEMQDGKIKKLPVFPILALGTTNVRIDTLREHLEAKNQFHQDAIDYQSGINKESLDAQQKRQEIELDKIRTGNEALLTDVRSRQQFQLIAPHFKNAFFLCKHNLSLSSFEDLQELSQEHGITMNQNYNNYKSGNEIINSIYEVVIEQLLDDIKSQQFVSISIDSQSTIAKREIMCMCIKYIDKNFILQEKYLAVLEMEGGTAEFYLEYTLKIIDKHQLNDYIYFLATDGAPVMVSENGLAGRLKLKIPYFVSLHCKAHKAALGVKQLSTHFNLIHDLNYLVYHIVSVFNTPKRAKIFRDSQVQLREIDYDETLGLIQPFDVRWISYFPAIQRIIQQLAEIITALKEICQQDYNPNIKHYKKKLQKLNTIIKLAHYADMLEPVYKLTKILQKRDLTLDTFDVELQVCLKSLDEFIQANNIYKGDLVKFIESKTTRVRQETKFDQKISLEAQGSFQEHFRKVSIKMSDIAKQLKQNIEDRFEEFGIIKSFRALCITTIQQNQTNKSFGEEDISQIIKHYQKNNSNFFCSLDENEVLAQYKLLKKQLQGCLLNLSYQEILSAITNTESFNKISRLMKLFCILPLTSVECERVFSQVGLIVTKRRNLLSTIRLNQLLMIARNSAEIQNFNFKKAFIYCQQIRNRYFI